jgi:hypothetical protein
MCRHETPRRHSASQVPSRKSSVSSSNISGDSRQRITVPMPRSLHELQGRATQLFGHNGELKMYHHGSVAIEDPSQLNKIQNGDVVVVTWNNRRLTKREFAELLETTNQRDFVKHPLPKKEIRASSQVPQMPSIPLDGVTSYKSEYVRHPLAKREACAKPSQSWSPPKEPTGKSTYEDQFPWRDPQLAVRQPQPQKVDGSRRKSEPFTGCTSYMQDYVVHPPKPRIERSTPARPRPRSASHIQFQGTSTYESEYTRKPILARTPQKPTALRLETLPFEGSSDYQSSYVNHRVERPMIHLEQELS